MRNVLDTWQIVFWTITYCLIIAYGLYDKQMRMPLVCGAFNFAWELSAVLYSLHWGRCLWLLLDIIILLINILWLYKKTVKTGKYIYVLNYILFIIGAAVGLFFLFRFVDGSMLISVFTIDILMATEYVLIVKYIPLRGKIPIAVTKLIGDLFAWFTYMNESPYIAVVGVCVLLLNLWYVACCMEENSATIKKKNKI